MNRLEKHQLIVQLYSEGKTMREISKEVHMSFGDIGAVIKKLNDKSEPENHEITKECKALKLFNKEKDPVEVAITLDLSALKVQGIYKQFLKLRGLSSMVNLYEKIKADVPLLARVYETVKKCNLTKDDLINIIDYAPDHLFLKDDIRELREQVQSLLNQKSKASTSLLSLKKKHTEFEERIDELSVISMRKMSYIESLGSKIKQLETYISKLKNSDEYYSKFERFAKQKLESVVQDNRWILPLTIEAVIESMQRKPFTEMVIKGTITNEDKARLLELGEVLFDKLLKQFTEFTLENSCQDLNSVNKSTPRIEPSSTNPN